jgi:glutamate-1-semialdehyde 2,1-aminomutase
VSFAVDRAHLARLLDRERREFSSGHPRSRANFSEATHLFGRVPMTWMNKRAGAFPLYLDWARGAHLRDVDGKDYVDFCLGDTGSMAGHSPPPVVAAVNRRMAELGGVNAMLPTADAEWVGAELERRFGLPAWSFSLTATDANRWVLRMARAVTGRARILVNSYCYHGTVDESLIVVGADGQAESREGNVGAPCDVTLTSRVAEFNDLDGLERELAFGDVAAVLMEPALTNIGIVAPEPGYHDGVRRLTRRYGSLLIIDETHTFSAGPGGATAAWDLEPDIVTIGKAIGGGIPAGAFGLSRQLSDQLQDRPDLDLVDMGGVGGTLAGNALSVAAMKATLDEVLTDDAFVHMATLAAQFAAGVKAAIERYRLPWHVSQLGARTEYRFSERAPRNGSESHAAGDDDLDDFMHIYMANRGILMTPFHNMALMSPATTAADVAFHTEVFDQAIAELTVTSV